MEPEEDVAAEVSGLPMPKASPTLLFERFATGSVSRSTALARSSASRSSLVRVRTTTTSSAPLFRFRLSDCGTDCGGAGCGCACCGCCECGCEGACCGRARCGCACCFLRISCSLPAASEGHLQWYSSTSAASFCHRGYVSVGFNATPKADAQLRIVVKGAPEALESLFVNVPAHYAD